MTTGHTNTNCMTIINTVPSSTPPTADLPDPSHAFPTYPSHSNAIYVSGGSTHIVDPEASTTKSDETGDHVNSNNSTIPTPDLHEPPNPSYVELTKELSFSPLGVLIGLGSQILYYIAMFT